MQLKRSNTHECSSHCIRTVRCESSSSSSHFNNLYACANGEGIHSFTISIFIVFQRGFRVCSTFRLVAALTCCTNPDFVRPFDASNSSIRYCRVFQVEHNCQRAKISSYNTLSNNSYLKTWHFFLFTNFSPKFKGWQFLDWQWATTERSNKV